MKKKKYFLFFLIALLFAFMPTILANQQTSIYINGVQLNTTVKMQNNRALLPIREFYEQDDYTVHWDNQTKTVYIFNGKTTIKLPSNKNIAYVNNKAITLDVQTKPYDGKTYIPVRFVNETMGYIVHWDNKTKKILVSTSSYASSKSTSTSFDVIVIGTDPEGIAAAIGAAREGQRTLLVDKRSKVGGLFTVGKLNSIDMNVSKEGRLVTRGIFEEFYILNNKKTAFDTKNVEKIFNSMLAKEPNITVVLNAKGLTANANNGHIDSLDVILSSGKTVRYQGKQFIDSTQNADIAYQVGESFTFGQQDYRQIDETMSVTQVFELSGVNYDKVFNHLNYADGNSGTGADRAHAWGYGEMANYPSSQKDVRMRGLNIGLESNGNVLINALQIVGIDGTNPVEIAEAKQKALAEIPKIVAYMNQNLVGFEKAKFAGVAEELYIRETRHLNGQYRLTVTDLLEHRNFPDKIAHGNYPIDVQTSETQLGYVVGHPRQYSIPFRSIVPKKTNNLLIASKAASYDSLAHGSARVVPIGMNVGQAAGIAAAYANKTQVNFITMAQEPSFGHVKNIQKILNAKGAYLNEFPIYDNPIVNHWSYDGIKFLRTYGLIIGGYDNNYSLDKKTTTNDFTNLLSLANNRSLTKKAFLYPNWSSNSPLKYTHIQQFANNNKIVLESALSPITLKKLKETDTVTRDILIKLIQELVKK